MAFVKNITDKEILLSSFEGYKFKIPTGTSWIWDKAGVHLLSNIYPTPTRNNPIKDKFGNPIPPTNGEQPLRLGDEKEWVKGGKRLAQVERFKVNHDQLGRKGLIKVALARGVNKDTITEWVADETIDPSEISEAINNLPVPEEVKYPKEIEEDGGDTLKNNEDIKQK